MWAPPGSQWNHMSLDAASYQNVSHELVDWAALAQQWIQMKEAHGVPVMHVPSMFHGHLGHNPLQPTRAAHFSSFQTNENQLNGGEAPMDVEKDDEHLPLPSDLRWAPQNINVLLPGGWVPPQQTLRLGLSQQAGNPIGLPPTFTHPQIMSSVSSIPPVFVNSQVAQPINAVGLPAVGVSLVSSPNASKSSNVPRLPLLLDQPRRGSSDEDSNGLPSSVAPSLDAAKRKNLPAWIREGLEKMEREKQKREEREKFLQERELNRKKLLCETSAEKDPAASRFDSDGSDSSDVENDGDIIPRIASTEPPSSQISAEDLMAVIRQLMTEVLLEVTTEEIRAAASDAYQQAKVKSRQVQHSLPSKSLTQKLGLDQYGSDSEEDSDGDPSPDEPTDTLTGSRGLDGDMRKTTETFSLHCVTEVGVSSLKPNITKVETDNQSVDENGVTIINGADISKEKETRNHDLRTEPGHSGCLDKKSHDVSNRKDEKRRRSSSRDRRRSRDRSSRRSRSDRSRSRRRSRSRGRRSRSRSKRRESSKDRKRYRSSNSKEKTSRRSRRANSRDRSQSRNRDYR